MDEMVSEMKQKMVKSVDITKQDLDTIRTGRAIPALVDQILITAYEGSQKLKVQELATVTTSDAHTILIQPFDPSTIEDISKGIQEANVGLNPVIDGEVIRVSIPALSQERREEYLKLAKAKLEAGRVMVRQVRQDTMSKLKRAYEAKEVIEDEKFRLEKQIQEITDEMIGQINELGEVKEKELMQI